MDGSGLKFRARHNKYFGGKDFKRCMSKKKKARLCLMDWLFLQTGGHGHMSDRFLF